MILLITRHVGPKNYYAHFLLMANVIAKLDTHTHTGYSNVNYQYYWLYLVNVIALSILLAMVIWL